MAPGIPASRFDFAHTAAAKARYCQASKMRQQTKTHLLPKLSIKNNGLKRCKANIKLLGLHLAATRKTNNKNIHASRGEPSACLFTRKLKSRIALQQWRVDSGTPSHKVFWHLLHWLYLRIPFSLLEQVTIAAIAKREFQPALLPALSGPGHERCLEALLQLQQWTSVSHCSPWRLLEGQPETPARNGPQVPSPQSVQTRLQLVST